MVSFDVSRDDSDLIAGIADRAEAIGMVTSNYDRMTLMMDVTACHANGCPLDLKRLYEADRFNFVHDIAGIARHMDRKSGQLTDCFLPRFAAKEG